VSCAKYVEIFLNHESKFTKRFLECSFEIESFNLKDYLKRNMFYLSLNNLNINRRQ